MIIFPRKMLLTVWLTVLASIALGFVISAVVKTGDKAMAIAPFVLIIQLLFSGILFYTGRGRRGDLLCDRKPLVGRGTGEHRKTEPAGSEAAGRYPMLEHERNPFSRLQALM